MGAYEYLGNPGTYNSGSPKQVQSRDAEINASATLARSDALRYISPLAASTQGAETMGDASEPARSKQTGPLRIRLLYVANCPHSDETLDLVRSCARSEGRRVLIEKTEVTSGEQVVRLRFLGSPTVQINGVDIEPSARGRTDGALTCRLYGRSGVPSPEMITAAIREATE